MNNFQTMVLIVGTIMLAISCFGLGWNVAESRERKALHALHTRYLEIEKWVEQNWPDQLTAWRNGHRQGYQRGVEQAAELEASVEDDQ